MRIERCEGVQLIAAAARIIVSSCHDCILHLGINRAPLLIGDNRFLQVLPYDLMRKLTQRTCGAQPQP